MMLPMLQEEVLAQDDDLEDMRKLFQEADIDRSGTLSVDEIYNVISQMGAQVSIEELIELMNEIDVDRNGELDVDEFIALMSMGSDVQFKGEASKNAFMSIKRARKLSALDLFKTCKHLP